jgi:hypothetical protein
MRLSSIRNGSKVRLSCFKAWEICSPIYTAAFFFLQIKSNSLVKCTPTYHFVLEMCIFENVEIPMVTRQCIIIPPVKTQSHQKILVKKKSVPMQKESPENPMWNKIRELPRRKKGEAHWMGILFKEIRWPCIAASLPLTLWKEDGHNLICGTKGIL